MSLSAHRLVGAVGEFRLGPISLTVTDDIVSMLGPSGCGKTTFLALLAGLRDPTSGTIMVHDTDVTDLAPEDRGIAMVFQNGALFPHMTARENIAYAATNTTRVEALAATLGISDILEQNATTLSGGERQRVALARALATDPAVLLLDEPLANLDAPVREQLRGEVRALLEDFGVPVIHVTHDQRAAAAIGDRVAVMRSGRIDHIDDATTVFTRPATPFVARFTGSCLLTATVQRTSTGVQVVWADTPLTTAPPSLTPGQTVDVAIRPDHLTVQESDTPASTGVAIAGRVTQHIFEGDRTRLQIAVPGGDTPLTLTVPPTTTAPPAVGERVTINIPPRAIHLIPPDPQSPQDDARAHSQS